MPLVSETAPRHRGRGRGRGWLSFALLPALLALFVAATSARPLRVAWGDQVLVVGTDMPNSHIPSGWHSVDAPPAPVLIPELAYNNSQHVRWLQLGSWAYGVRWFKGHGTER